MAPMVEALRNLSLSVVTATDIRVVGGIKKVEIERKPKVVVTSCSKVDKFDKVDLAEVATSKVGDGNSAVILTASFGLEIVEVFIAEELRNVSPTVVKIEVFGCTAVVEEYGSVEVDVFHSTVVTVRLSGSKKHCTANIRDEVDGLLTLRNVSNFLLQRQEHNFFV
uniref:Uncharacterized protein n=1 Tax=Romanomermis culicivorax TaxID=13658 RepID=A0A915K245_ROMCU